MEDFHDSAPANQCSLSLCDEQLTHGQEPHEVWATAPAIHSECGEPQTDFNRSRSKSTISRSDVSRCDSVESTITNRKSRNFSRETIVEEFMMPSVGSTKTIGPGTEYHVIPQVDESLKKPPVYVNASCQVTEKELLLSQLRLVNDDSGTLTHDEPTLCGLSFILGRATEHGRQRGVAKKTVVKPSSSSCIVC